MFDFRYESCIMGYETDELSLKDSNPIELYLFKAGANYWAQNSSTVESISYEGRLYEPYGLSRSHKRLTSNSLKNTITIKTVHSNPFVQPYIQAPPDAEVEFFLYRGHNGDYIPFWQGFISKVNFKSKYVEIIASPMTSRLKRNGLIRRYSRLCSLALYSTKCGVSPAIWSVIGDVDSVSGITITSTDFGAKSDGYFNGGWIDANGYTRMIASHIGDDVILNSRVPGLVAGMAFTAYKGCLHNRTACIEFNNILNYGGQPWIPDKNPFGQGGIK